MSCYLRHMKEILAEAGIELTPANKKQIDQAFHQIAGVAHKECPATWRKLKQEFMSDEASRRELAQKLKQAIR